MHERALHMRQTASLGFIKLELKVGFWGLCPPDPNRGSAHGPRWGTHVRQIPSNLYPQPRKSS